MSKRICQYPGCNKLSQYNYCDEHRKTDAEKKDIERQAKARRDKQRPNAHQRGYNYRWKQYRQAFLARNALCVECMKDNRVVPATVVDHIVPHKGDQKVFWDKTNHQALCKPCHDRKTLQFESGFVYRGHPSKVQG